MVHFADGAKLNISTPTPNSYRSIKVLASAKYSKVDLKPASGFVFGVDNKSEEYLEKFPCGQIPTIELKDGFNLSQSDAIIQFIGSSSFLRKDCPKANALILQYANWASHEINRAQTILSYPCLGLVQPEKAKMAAAKEKLELYLGILNEALTNRTFIIGDRVTFADVSVACELILPLKYVMEPTIVAKYPHMKRWFITMINQPELKQYIGEYEFCVKPKPFDAKRYNELFPKETKSQPKKEQQKKEVPAPTPAPVKKKDVFADLPPSEFVLDDFKRTEANKDAKTVTIPYLWEHFDKQGFSFWFCEYKYNDELTMGFLAKNLIRGMFDGLNSISKHLYGSFLILGQEKDYKIRGVWLQRGQDLIFNLDHDAIFDADIFDFKKLDVDVAADKQLIENYIIKDDVVDGLPVYETVTFR